MLPSMLFTWTSIVNLALVTGAVPTHDPRNTPMKRLYNHLFTTYKKDVRPVLNDSLPVEMKVNFWLKQILKVNEGDQILTIYCWLELYWMDEYLRWEPGAFDGIESMHVPAKSVWQPDLLVYNNANMNIDESELETNAMIKHNGEVSLFRSVITDITCSLDLTYFPFDEQACYIMLASWSYDSSKMNLLAYQNLSDIDALKFYINNSEWNLEQFEGRRNLKFYECCPDSYPDLSYYFVLSRNPAYYILSLVIPSAFITVVTIIGFFTPHSSSGENNEKVSLGVTALLSMAIIMMMVADEMPATSKVMPLIGKYYIGLIFILFAAAFSTTITLSIQMRGISDDGPRPWMKRLFFCCLARCFIISFMLPECPDPVAWQEEMDELANRRLSSISRGRLPTDNDKQRQTSFHFLPPSDGKRRAADTYAKYNGTTARSQVVLCTEYALHKQQPTTDDTLAPLASHATSDSDDGSTTCDEPNCQQQQQQSLLPANNQQQQPHHCEHNGRSVVQQMRDDSAVVCRNNRHRRNHNQQQLQQRQRRCERCRTNSLSPVHNDDSDATSAATVVRGVRLSQQQHQHRRIHTTVVPPQQVTSTGEQLARVAGMVDSIRADLESRVTRERIARQWRQIARITERGMMCFFIVFVTLFAGIMLSDRAPKTLITKQLMDRLSKLDELN